jgi:hypothetical protein
MPRIIFCPATEDRPPSGLSNRYFLRNSIMSKVVAALQSAPPGRLVDPLPLAHIELRVRMAEPPAKVIIATSLIASAIYKCWSWICSRQYLGGTDVSIPYYCYNIRYAASLRPAAINVPAS